MRRLLSILGVYADILKANLSADDGTTTIIAHHVKAAAGAHADDRRLVLRCFSQRRNARIKAAHQFIHFVLKTKHGSNDARVFPHTLHDTQLAVGGKIHDRSDFSSMHLVLGKTTANKDNIRLARHDSFQISFLDQCQDLPRPRH